MKSKKLLSVIVISAVIFSSAPAAFAKDISSVQGQVSVKVLRNGSEIVVVSEADEQNAKITKDAAKVAAKKMLKDNFGIDIDETKYQSRIYFRSNYEYTLQGYVWDISWNQSSSEKSSDISVSIDAATGKVLRVYKNGYTSGQSTISTITEDKAKEIGEDFLKKLNPEEFKQVKLLPNNNFRLYYYNPTNYSFNYARVVDGVKFDGNMLTVEVNGVTGKVTGYSYRWTDNLKLPSVKGIVVDYAKATEAFKKQVKLNLNYVSYTDKYSPVHTAKNVKLVFTPDNSQGQMFDARLGKMIDSSGDSNPEIIVKDLTAKEKEDFYKNLKPFQTLNKEISKDRATEVIKQKLKVLYGDGYTIDSINYSENEYNYEYSGKKVWVADFRKSNSTDYKMGEGGQIVIDALTEGVINLYKYNYGDYISQGVEPKYSWSEMYVKAVDALGKYYPDKAKEVSTKLSYVNWPSGQGEKYYGGTYVNYHFQRVVNGIPFRDNSIDISFNSMTGELTELRCYWDNKITFPEPNKILSVGDASKIFFNVNKLELVYAIINTSTDYTKPNYEAKLVYRLNSSAAAYPTANIDAFSGKFLDDEMQEIDDNIASFKKKIKGSAVEKELTILAAQGVIDTKTFELNKKVTKLDLIKMLVNAKGYRPGILMEAEKLEFKNSAAVGDTNYKYLQMAVYYGIIDNNKDEIKLDDTVTREDMAKALVKLLGYDKLAQSKDIFVINSADAKEVSSSNVGYVAIAKGVGILLPTNNKLRPKATATMSELALGIYKVLGNIRTGY